ncbi:MAG: hypothetical protein FWD87_02085 [Spirochaetaceae bacterium]|nr:hypothetical protein [Spirochaetaceae bacterium]
MVRKTEATTNVWKNRLIITDLATGNVNRALQADYYITTNTIGGEPTLDTTALFFPHSSTRHIPPSREVPTMLVPGNFMASYNSLPGLAYNLIANFEINTPGSVQFID